MRLPFTASLAALQSLVVVAHGHAGGSDSDHHVLLPVQLRAPTAEHFLPIVSNDTYDFGCRPIARPVTADGSSSRQYFELHALLTRDQIAHLSHEYRSTDVSLHEQTLTKRAATAPIGTGDRFQSGTVAPKGLGTQASGTTIASIMNLNEISSAVNGLVSVYKTVTTFTLPYKTFEGRTQFAAYVGAGTDTSKYHLYLSAAVHARERGGPDNLIYWISDLLSANKTGSGLTYGKKTYTNAQVKSVLAAGIVFFPVVNPDGVAYDQSSGSLWRKNRNTKSGSSGASVGVDINRNFDFLWNFPKYFASSASPASTSPSSQTFYGTAAQSEPETKNHVSVYDKFPKIRWFMDVHSAAGDILYSWGDDENQSTNTAMNFLSSTYDGKRGIVGDTAYKEYIPSADATNVKKVADATVAAMKAVGGRSYITQQAVGLYATSGATDDYAFSRYWSKSGQVNKVYGYTMEFGYSTNFYPTLTEFNQNILDTNAGFMDWALAAISVGLE
ncbi:hypothetical protein B0H66DRAFT_506214 [Apodospora peruviana]|uniref:Peptidase M14 domain-containing protein n=1 Tax=Apodospora peruviana TaxID=516989 RepID=A0AAE0LYN4_9PEZI|nr:hypothetical protein B0H66DRAFT_506214 [Apodospora peruviana]